MNEENNIFGENGETLLFCIPWDMVYVVEGLKDESVLQHHGPAVSVGDLARVVALVRVGHAWHPQLELVGPQGIVS